MSVAISDRPVIEISEPSSVRAFLAVLRRDLWVTGRELPVFLAQVGLQPLFLLFVFGKVLTSLGYARPGYAELLFPGIVALTATLTGIQSTALPLVLEFSFSREIEDRLLAPMPTWSVAIEKMLFASMRALLAATVMFPVGIWVLGSIPWRAAAAPRGSGRFSGRRPAACRRGTRYTSPAVSRLSLGLGRMARIPRSG